MRFPKTVNHRTGERKCCINYRSDFRVDAVDSASERSILAASGIPIKGNPPVKEIGTLLSRLLLSFVVVE